MNPREKSIPLGTLKVGSYATIDRIVSDDPEQGIGMRLRELGFIEGAKVRILHEAPFGGDPIVVEVRGALLALRRQEASQIEVHPDQASGEIPGGLQ